VAIPISVDTYKARVAEEMLDLGVDLINDISGLHFDESLASVVARFDAGLVIMHIKGRPRTMQRNPRYKDLMGEIYWYLSDGLERARQAGVAQSRIIVDPGIGFGKSFKDNHQILRRLSELNGLGRPIMVGLSRKSFIGNILNLPSEERLEGSLSAAVLALLNGARWLRVHDLEATRRAVRVAEAILKE
jgi:dihydropteroate synthase